LLLQCYLRATELEMQAVEEPSRSNLDVAELRSRVLERVEELGAQEHEREELLVELLPHGGGTETMTLEQ
jgi:hypothetical protein